MMENSILQKEKYHPIQSLYSKIFVITNKAILHVKKKASLMCFFLKICQIKFEGPDYTKNHKMQSQTKTDIFLLS